jgi:zinc protease
MRFKFLFSCFLLLFFSALSFSQLDIKFEKYTLQNGLQVILHEDHSVPIVAVNLWYHVAAAREKPGRSGFAHLFEHLMFESSQHTRDGLYDEIIEGAGGSNNGSTGFDRTNYWLIVPKNYVEPALWLESDRMGFLLPGITQDRLDLQRSVVKNERRQSYENQPYGMAFMKILEALYPPGVPYHWLPIGSQEDLSAASLEDVKDYFRTWYVPSNISLCIGGDFSSDEMKKMVDKYFTDIPAGKPVPKPVPMMNEMTEVKSLVLEDKVQLPRLYIFWPSPAQYLTDDAELDILSDVLSNGKNSRLYKSLVYEKQIAQSIGASQNGNELSGFFGIIATAKPGHSLSELRKEIFAEIDKILAEGVTERELQRSKNGRRSGFIYQLQNVGGFGGKTDLLNAYNTFLGEPDMFNYDLGRYEKVTADAVKRVCNTYLKDKGHVELSIVPTGKLDLQAKP